MSHGFFIQNRLSVAISRLFAVASCQNHLVGDIHVAGISIIVGIRIFSIVAGLGSGGGLCRGFGQLRQEGLAPLLPHRLKRQARAWAQL